MAFTFLEQHGNNANSWPKPTTISWKWRSTCINAALIPTHCNFPIESYSAIFYVVSMYIVNMYIDILWPINNEWEIKSSLDHDILSSYKKTVIIKVSFIVIVLYRYLMWIEMYILNDFYERCKKNLFFGI